MQPENILLIDIDGLRPDVFSEALKEGQIPNISSLLGGPEFERGVQIPIIAPAPSITFCSQACLFTSAHPKHHGIPGNQFFDRFGTYNNGIPRHFAFDVGDTLAVDDAIRVFTDALADSRLLSPTFYERMANHGKKAVVAGNMYARGAESWLKPSLTKIAQLTKGGELWGIKPEEYDRHLLEQAIFYIQNHGLPDVLTMYFLGLDSVSHTQGPQAQFTYLNEHVDPMIGELVRAIRARTPHTPFTALFSDHGQIEVMPDDRHALRIGFPFDREMGHLFSALGLDVHDYPGEDPDCDAVLALNGGLAFVYLRNRTDHWAEPPDFNRDILPVAQAFWENHQTGRDAEELKGALAGVLLRNVEQHGWETQYQAVTPEGAIISLEEWFQSQPEEFYIDPVHRLNNLAGLYSGDLILISDYAEGFYFGGKNRGVHGGLHPDDSLATLAFGWSGVSSDIWEKAERTITEAIHGRCKSEGSRQPSTCDLMTGIEALLYD